jgi:hypothetical protein
VVVDSSSLEGERSRRRSFRNAGYLMMGGAVAAGTVAGLAVALGTTNNDEIRVGGFATAQDIEARAERGRRYNLLAWCMAGAGVALGGTGFALILANPDPRARRLVATPVEGGAVVSFSGVLP